MKMKFQTYQDSKNLFKRNMVDHHIDRLNITSFGEKYLYEFLTFYYQTPNEKFKENDYHR